MSQQEQDALNRAAALPRAEDVDTLETSILITLDCYVQAILVGDVETYISMTSPDVSVYEWYIQGGRMEGRSLHEEMTRERPPVDDLEWSIADAHVRFAGKAAIVDYTLRVSGIEDGQELFAITDETRIFEAREQGWICVHSHKSPHGTEDPG